MHLACKLPLLAIACAGLMGYAPSQPLLAPGSAVAGGLPPPRAAATDAGGTARPAAVAGVEIRAAAPGVATAAGLAAPRARERAAPAAEPGPLIPVGSVPEPGPGTLLLASLLAVALIALRRSRRQPR